MADPLPLETRRKMLRRWIRAGGTNVSKTDLESGIQSLENWYEDGGAGSGKNTLGGELETAIPGILSNAEKKVLGAIWFEYKAETLYNGL